MVPPRITRRPRKPSGSRKRRSSGTCGSAWDLSPSDIVWPQLLSARSARRSKKPFRRLRTMAVFRSLMEIRERRLGPFPHKRVGVFGGSRLQWRDRLGVSDLLEGAHRAEPDRDAFVVKGSGECRHGLAVADSAEGPDDSLPCECLTGIYARDQGLKDSRVLIEIAEGGRRVGLDRRAL